MAGAQALCPSCGSSRRLFSRANWNRHRGRLRIILRDLVGLAQVLVLGGLGLVLMLKLSPLILLFPIFLICCSPPASRGGKTVVRGRRRR